MGVVPGPLGAFSPPTPQLSPCSSLRGLCHFLNGTRVFLDVLSPKVDSFLKCSALCPHQFAPLHPHTKTPSIFFSRKCSYSNTNGLFPKCPLSFSLTVLLLPSVDYYLLFISHDTVLCFLQDIKEDTTPALSLQPRRVKLWIRHHRKQKKGVH